MLKSPRGQWVNHQYSRLGMSVRHTTRYIVLQVTIWNLTLTFHDVYALGDVSIPNVMVVLESTPNRIVRGGRSLAGIRQRDPMAKLEDSNAWLMPTSDLLTHTTRVGRFMLTSCLYGRKQINCQSFIGSSRQHAALITGLVSDNLPGPDGAPLTAHCMYCTLYLLSVAMRDNSSFYWGYLQA